ncbi:hypothetical protein Poli38472_013021 [Pythium oligandrum]|uniref:Peptidase M14 domain-containing protein n=1 Tax=Pythium oligandrum TaxID=41045 RepID=A0A8K1CJV2_PYTOL|nr:hypothetical protein Poli38472_013021 [Pythium oligandrum]|eukprot:TMW64399.1 hypothetical protein Poli38472_013021 [Pythium oligandrum]
MKLFTTVLALASLAAAPCTAEKQLVRVEGPRAAFDMFIEEHKGNVDILRSRQLAEGNVAAELYGDASLINQLNHHTSGRFLESTEQVLKFVVADSTDDLIKREQKEVASCHEKTADYVKKLGDGNFADSAFHDCWRTSTQVFEFLDKLVALSPEFLNKTEEIGRTIEGKPIPLYKISKTNSTSDKPKQALYAQSLIHAREWQSGGSIFYTIAGMLDGLRSGDARVHAIFDSYDWYFVPVLNIDGYDYSWKTERLWRKNRRSFFVKGKQYYGVDLNRNFGPLEYFDLDKNSANPSSTTYPGLTPLSEPESTAVFAFLRTLGSSLAGTIDVHMNAQTVLRPFSNQRDEAPEPYKTKLTNLGDAMRQAIQKDSELKYDNAPSASGLYMSYGTFKDAVFLELSKTASYTLELEREDGDFITKQTTIRPVGKRTLACFLAFSEGIATYYK